MAPVDPASALLVGRTVWHVAQWLEAHDTGEPYEIFDGGPFGYRLTVERIAPPV